MVTLGEVIYALRGIARLMRLDRGGLAYFDRSIQGFWRSFSVALLIAPLYALLIPSHLEMIKPTVDWPQIMAIEILAYIVAWLLFPTVAFELCRWLKRPAEYPGYITVYNWSSILFVGTRVLVWLPTLAGSTSAGLSDTLDTIAYYLFQVYLWFIAREALRIDGITAIGVVFTDFVLTLALSVLYQATLTP